MKDIVDKLQDSLEYEFNLSFSERKQLLERVKEDEKVKETLDNMVRERQIRINKAIEYLKENACYEKDTKLFCRDLDYSECLKLLNILEGE